MAVRVCPNKIDCPGTDFPITNYSAEGAESEPFWNSAYYKNGCLTQCVSEVSQLDADLCALAQVCPDPVDDPNDPSDPDPDASEVTSAAATCTKPCTNGSQYTYTLPAGEFSGTSQEAVDAQAAAYACEVAEKNPCCLGDVDEGLCHNDAYSATLSVTGGTAILYELESGTLPTGLSLTDQGVLSGTPTTAGTYTFEIQATLDDGNYITRTYTLTVYQILTASLAAATVGVAYSATLLGLGGGLWSVVSGTLPSGLHLLGGVISGTPTTDGISNFTVGYAECSKVLSLTVGTGLLAYFKCDEASPITELDNSVADHDLDLQLPYPDGVSVAGILSTALRTGTADRIFASDTDEYWDVGASFTVRFWLRRAASYALASVFNLYNDDGSFEIHRVINPIDGEVTVSLECETAAGTESLSSSTLVVNQWNHVVCWFENGVGMGIKINDGAASTFATVSPIQLTGANHNLNLAISHNGTDEAVDEIAVWKRKLTDAEITSDYNSGVGKTYPDIPS